MSFNVRIWKYLYDKGLRDKDDIDQAYALGIFTETEYYQIIPQDVTPVS